ncbi:MAG: ABC transporter permease [Fimbriimonadaceae bacterium]
MNLFQSFLVALDMLRMHKLRAVLTMLGVIIGVMSVTTIVMVSSGFQHYMTNQFKQLGADSIYVFFDPGARFHSRERTGTVESLKMEDVAYLLERVPVLDIASAAARAPTSRVRFGDREVSNAEIVAGDHFYHVLNRVQVSAGRHLTESDLTARANVAIIGQEIRDRLFPDGDAVGRQILLPGITLEVVGVYEKMDIMGGGNARIVMLPLSTMQDKWIGGDRIDFITLRPKPGVDVQDAMNRTWEALMLKSGNQRIYRVESNESITQVFASLITVAGAVLAAIAALSLLVGGIGIMNIMLVSVTERTREIGLRKAVGAKNGSVLTQFLVESATLSLVGGLIGMGIAWSLGKAVSLITAWREWPMAGGLATPFPLPAAIAAAAFSALIGVVFGLYPAARAASLSPIQALRTE